MTDLTLKGWLPQEPWQGPPLPEFLSIYWPWYEFPGAEFKVSNLVISPTEVNPGKPVTISCTVKNIGGEPGTHIVTLGGDFVAEQSVALGPDESKTIAFEVVPPAAKTYNVTVDGLSASFVATEAPAADIRVENLIIEPSEAIVGEKVLITVTATNYGGAPGTKKIVCTVS